MKVPKKPPSRRFVMEITSDGCGKFEIAVRDERRGTVKHKKGYDVVSAVNHSAQACAEFFAGEIGHIAGERHVRDLRVLEALAIEPPKMKLIAQPGARAARVAGKRKKYPKGIPFRRAIEKMTRKRR